MTSLFPAFTTNSGGSKLGKPWPRSTQESPSILELRGMEWVIMIHYGHSNPGTIWYYLVLPCHVETCGKSTGCVFCQDVGLPGLPNSYQFFSFFSFPAPLTLVVFFMHLRWTRLSSGHVDCSTKGQYILVNGSKQLADIRDR